MRDPRREQIQSAEPTRPRQFDGVLQTLGIDGRQEVEIRRAALLQERQCCTRLLLAMDHITDQLSLIRVPTLLIGGDRDPSLEPMRGMHKKVRGSKLVVLSPASHFANRDQPEAWDRAALDFLATVDAGKQRR